MAATTSHVPPLETRRSSAALRGERTGIRQLPVVSKFIDTSTCIGCKACEVACQEWNDLGVVATEQVGTYQTLPSLDASYWNLIKFREQELPGGGLAWLMRKDQCMHCADPGCLRACPAPGAIVQYANGIVDVNADRCIGCGLCATGCPFDVPRFHAQTGKMSKCTLCVDRVEVGLEPACIKACPTGCLQFGTKIDMLALGTARVKQLQENGFPQAALYDPAGVGGTGVVTVLAHGDHPDWYDLPANPHIPLSVRITKSLLKPLGLAAVLGSVVGSFGHFLGYGPKETVDPVNPLAPPPPPTPAAGTAEDTVVGERIVRHALASRVIHWTVALCFFVTLLTGLPIWTPIFQWMGSLFGGLAVCRWLHPWAGIGFVAAGAAMFAYWLHDMRMEAGDWSWLGPRMLDYFRRRGPEDPAIGKYNGGQKIFFYLVGLLAVLLLVTGVVLWFPLSFPGLLRGVSWPLHDVAFLVFAVAIVGHIYLGTAAIPGTFRSMTRGTVSKGYARTHHPRWYREVTGDVPGPRGPGGGGGPGGTPSPRPTPPAGVPAPPVGRALGTAPTTAAVPVPPTPGAGLPARVTPAGGIRPTPATTVPGRLTPAAGVPGRLTSAVGVPGRLTPASGIPGRPALTPPSGLPARPAGTPAADVPGRPAIPAAGVPGRLATPAAGVPGRPATPAAGVPGRPGTPAAGVPGRPAGIPGRSGTPAGGAPTTEGERGRGGTGEGDDPAGR